MSYSHVLPIDSQDSQQAYKECLKKLLWAADALEINCSQEQLAPIAELIADAMTGFWRHFHTPEHVFDVGGAEDPVEVLAALFHDLVYVQVDGSINFNLSYYLAPFVKQVKDKLYIRPSEEIPIDPLFEMVLSVFGFKTDQFLSPFGGQNEFLSALIAAKVLEPFLSLQDLLKVAACIEATIPFQGVSEEGLTVSERLRQRLEKTNQAFELKFDDAELEAIVKQAVRVSNRDVISFSHPSSAHFLDNTWNLLPETNHCLIQVSTYTVRDYRVSLQKMAGFMNYLTPELIFRQYKGEPSDEEYQGLLERAGRNLAVARLYLGCKLFTISMLEAFSMQIGLNIPLSTLMGELPSVAPNSPHLESFLPEIAEPWQPRTDLEKEVLDLFEQGRASVAFYDLKHSPLTAFIVKSIGFPEITKQMDSVEKLFKGSISAKEFLTHCPPQVLEVAAESVLKILHHSQLALACWGATNADIEIYEPRILS